MRTVAEVQEGGPVPLWRHPEWQTRFTWLEHGVTGREQAGETLDFGLFGAAPAGDVTRRWRSLRGMTRMRSTVHSRQVHGAEVAEWTDPIPPGFLLVDGYDAHLSLSRGLLLTISVADCVPIFVVAEAQRAVALVHAGWRGLAAGVLEASLDRLRSRADAPAADLWLHCGPSICGACYEVGPEVHVAVSPEQPVPATPMPIDLTRVIARRALASGLPAERLTASTHCTRCGPGRFFSHRGGATARQLGVLGLRL